MIFRYERADNNNLLVLDQEGTALACTPGALALVGLREISLSHLRAAWGRFKVELRHSLCDALSKTPSEFAEWHLFRRKYQFDGSVSNSASCVGFKRYASKSPKLSYLRQKAVIRTLLDMELVPRTDAHGSPRKQMVRGEGGIPTYCQALPLEQQREVLRTTFADRSASLDDIIRLSQSSLVDTESIDQLLREAPDSESAMNGLARALFKFDLEQKVAGKSTAVGAGRHYAAPWFCIYLAREGYVLLPELTDSEYLLPRLLAPFVWTIFVPADARKFAQRLVQQPGEKAWAYTAPVYRELLLRTNFFRTAASSFTLAHFLKLKGDYTSAETGHTPPRASSDRLGHGLNRLFEAYLNFHGRTWEDVGPDARFFGGGRNIVADNGREAFAWVEAPRGRKSALYRKLIGEPPKHFPDFIQEWARDLRSLLPMFRVQHPSRQIDHLNHWLIYLIKLGDAAPRSWQEIDRERHINHVGLGTHLTLIEFLRGLDRENRQGIVSDVQKAWHLAAMRDGFASKITCPVDFRVDHLGWADGGGNSRTRRKSIPEQVYQIIVEENRRDSFAFARSLTVSEGPRRGHKIHWRTVVDQNSRERTEVFWPGLPIILDVILSMGVRQSSAMWMDSGEGDEYWVDPGRVEKYLNILPSRTKGRSAGFLRVCQIGPSEVDKVLGMYLAVNKTGPYEAAWVDPATARYFVEMRDWQVRWNGRRTPLKASRNDIQMQYAGEGTIPEVYPLFRDPESRSSHPPSPPTLYAYWTALLKHCEPIVREKFGHNEPLLKNERPRWDLHSLRVTTVSTLLENGVEPWIVAELVGHASVVMTWHYKDVDPRKTHAALQQAHEARRRRAIDYLQKLADEECTGGEAELDAKIEKLIGGLVKLREDHVGASSLRVSMAEENGYEIFSHGICPGGDCKAGGQLYKNAHQSVFRPRACSRCRFRLTGPAFLAGLVHRMNSLMVEIKASMEQEARLNVQIEDAEDRRKGDSGAVRVLRGLVARQRELRDELYAEWCAEMSTIRTAEGMLDQAREGSTLPVFSGMDLGGINARTDTVHQLALLHAVLADGNVILGASLEIPDGLKERRDALLLEIARHNGMGAFLQT